MNKALWRQNFLNQTFSKRRKKSVNKYLSILLEATICYKQIFTEIERNICLYKTLKLLQVVNQVQQKI